jgi:CheY-like chemotaxis protein
VRILAVDDEADMRDYVSFVLEQSGAEVTVAASAQEALTALVQIQPDVLVTDIGMPNTDGYMLLQQIRALNQEPGKQIPAIALTAYAGEYDQKRAIAAGFQIHLPKPVEPDALLEAIASLIERT